MYEYLCPLPIFGAGYVTDMSIQAHTSKFHQYPRTSGKLSYKLGQHLDTNISQISISEMYCIIISLSLDNVVCRHRKILLLRKQGFFKFPTHIRKPVVKTSSPLAHLTFRGTKDF